MRTRNRAATLTKRDVRQLLRGLCGEAGIDPEGTTDYLQAHGARRGLGDTLYREREPDTAQRALCQEDPQTTAKAYQYIDASASIITTAVSRLHRSHREYVRPGVHPYSLCDESVDSINEQYAVVKDDLVVQFYSWMRDKAIEVDVAL